MSKNSPLICAPVFYPASSVILILVVAGIVSDETLAAVFAELQASITTALPFTIIIILMIFSFMKELRKEKTG